MQGPAAASGVVRRSAAAAPGAEADSNRDTSGVAVVMGIRVALPEERACFHHPTGGSPTMASSSTSSVKDSRGRQIWTVQPGSTHLGDMVIVVDEPGVTRDWLYG
ncbi:hypothetical protein PVAP13_4NG154581 [Panicum virgatum]|uniref:Uncharacterized protein n=1 Tax=Panicum virgatum TaxID=38727 RepID=A0A8T0T932_PANVG|nr:hypothetical protein PVAP13_4NG154581 [Panicum virgatum]